MLKMKKNLLIVTAVLVPLLFNLVPAQADSKKKQVEPIELLINFQITGQFSGFTTDGKPLYTLNGPGFAPMMITNSAEISDKIHKNRQVTELQGAQITFTGAPTDPVLEFTCLPGSCNMPFEDGSVLSSDAGVPLAGRAINFWGPVINSPDFDPINGIAPIRIMGCGGLKEIEGKGKYAGMVGSICFNGTLNFNMNDPSTLTGSSKCTITLHTPADPGSIP